jgi:ATP-binding cassette, subfamily B, heavy metal transporter
MKDFLKTIRTFYSFYAKRRGWFVLAMTTILAASITSSIVPYFYKLFVDALPSGEYNTLVNIIFLYIGVLFLSQILSELSFIFGDIIAVSSVIDARVTIFKHLQDLDFAFHANKSTGSLISRMKRGDNAYWDLEHSIHHRMIEVIVGFMVMMYFFSGIDLSIVLIVFTSFLFSLVLMRFFIGYNILTRKDHNKEEDKVSGIIVDNIINFETVKLFSKEEWERKRIEKAFVPWKRLLWRHFWSYRIINMGIGSLVNISIFLILLLGLNLIVEDQLTTGEFILVLGFASAFFPKLFELVYSLRNVAKSYADIQKYFGILDYNVEIKDPKKPVELDSVRGEIGFKNVSFAYDGGKKNALRNFNLTIRQGQSIALVGRSGSGKTTLTKLLMRFYDVDKGSITIDGVNIKDLTKSHLRSFIGVVPQEPVLFNNTIAYNIGYGEKYSKNEIIAAAKIANLHKFIETLPKKYNTDVGERGIKLSGGQKQRLAIARMVLSDPEIVIFDEATSQLDSENERKIQEAFWKVVSNKTTIIIAHRLATAMRADKIIVMENGKIIEQGSHRNLLSKNDSLYKYFWDLQVDVS